MLNLKLKLLIKNVSFIVIDVFIKTWILMGVMSVFSNYAIVVVLITIFALRFLIFRLYSLIQIIKYIVQFDLSEYNILECSLTTSFWYIDEIYVRGAIILPVRTDLKSIVCSSVKASSPFGTLRHSDGMIVYKLYEMLISPLLGVNSVMWEFKDNYITKSTGNVVKIKKNNDGSAFLTTLLKLEYDSGIVEYQRDTIDEDIIFTPEMERLYYG